MPILIRRIALICFCLSMLSQQAIAQTVEYMSPDEALSLEHQTRYQRLRRFVESYRIFPEPQFFDYTVPAANMPANFRHDVPVLRIVFPESTFFDTGSAEILASAYPIIAAMAKMLDGDVPDVNVFVAGHTDSRGGEDYNHNLSVARAKAVTAALVGSRTRSYSIWSIGFGESLPIYPNTDDHNMAYNRRVEFLLGARPEAVSYWLQQQYDLVCQTSDPTAKLRCMLELRNVRHVYQAEQEGPRQAVALSLPKQNRVASQDRRVAVTPTPPKRMTIQLNEQRLRVGSIEH
jgi:OOP family OmpA-OmpF porin